MKTKWQEQIIFNLINSTEHEKLLAKVPNRSFLDMSVVYGRVQKLDDRTMKYEMINNSIMEAHELTEEQLYNLAMENTSKLIPFKVRTGEQLLRTMWEQMYDEAWPEHLSNVAPECLFLTNEYWHFGANALLYKEVFDEIADQLGENLYIIPSTCHELFVVKEGNIEPEHLAGELQRLNENSIRTNDVLSDQIYRYDKVKREFSQVTDFPKRAFSERRKKEMRKEEKNRSTAR